MHWPPFSLLLEKTAAPGQDYEYRLPKHWSDLAVMNELGKKGMESMVGEGWDFVCFWPGPDTMLYTIIPESIPTNQLQVNRWVLVDDDGMSDTTPPPGGGGGPGFDFTIQETRGRSCEQIIEAWAPGWGHTKFGCSTGVMLQWIAYVADYSLAQIESEPPQVVEGAIQSSSFSARPGWCSRKPGHDTVLF
jgi:hypothetical protein